MSNSYRTAIAVSIAFGRDPQSLLSWLGSVKTPLGSMKIRRFFEKTYAVHIHVYPTGPISQNEWANAVQAFENVLYRKFPYITGTERSDTWDDVVEHGRTFTYNVDLDKKADVGTIRRKLEEATIRNVEVVSVVQPDSGMGVLRVRVMAPTRSHADSLWGLVLYGPVTTTHETSRFNWATNRTEPRHEVYTYFDLLGKARLV